MDIETEAGPFVFVFVSYHDPIYQTGSLNVSMNSTPLRTKFVFLTFTSSKRLDVRSNLVHDRIIAYAAE